MYHEQCMSAAIPYWVLSVFLVFFQSDGQKIASYCFRLQFSDQASFYVFWRFAFSPLWIASSNPNPLFYWAFSMFLIKLYSTLCIGKTFTFCLLHVLQIFFFHSVLCLLTLFIVSFVIQKFLVFYVVKCVYFSFMASGSLFGLFSKPFFSGFPGPIAMFSIHSWVTAGNECPHWALLCPSCQHLGLLIYQHSVIIVWCWQVLHCVREHRERQGWRSQDSQRRQWKKWSGSW